VFCALHDQLASLCRHAQLTRCFSAVAELLVYDYCIGLFSNTVLFDIRIHQQIQHATFLIFMDSLMLILSFNHHSVAFHAQKHLVQIGAWFLCHSWSYPSFLCFIDQQEVGFYSNGQYTRGNQTSWHQLEQSKFLPSLQRRRR